MSKKILFVVMLFLIGISLVIFTGCPSGGGTNPPGDSTIKEAVKWTKVTQLGRPGISDRNKFAKTSYNNGWAISMGYFWRLNNGIWTKEDSYGDIHAINMYAIAFLDENIGWAIGYDSNESHDVVWKYSGGKWTDLSSNYTGSSMLYHISTNGCSIALTDSNTGWAVCDGGVYGGKILKLESGVWSEYSPNPVTDDYGAVDLIDSGSGWAAADTSGSGKFIQLSDGSWTDSGQTFSGSISKIVLAAIDDGFAYGSKVWELTSGPSWGLSGVSDPAGTYDSISYLGVKNTGSGTYSGWAYCDPDIDTADDEVLKKFTYDGSSTTWSDETMPSAAIPVKIMDDGTSVWAVCSNGAVWNYDGASWNVTTGGGAYEFYFAETMQSDFIDINNGRVVGYAGERGVNLILKNGSWNFGPTISNVESFDSIKLIDIDTGWAGKYQGGDKMFAKLSNGVWTLNDFTAWYTPKTIALVDADNGWAAGTIYYNDGTIIWYYDTFWKLDQTNGWVQAQQFSTNYSPIYIHLDDMDNGWATARNGAKWVLSGGTWTLNRQGRPEADGLHDEFVMFYTIDANNGWQMIYEQSAGKIRAWKLINNVWGDEIPQADLPFTIGSLPVCAFTDMNNGWAARGDMIYKLENGKWLPYNADANGYPTVDSSMDDSIVYIWLQDYKNGWAIGSHMNIYRLSPDE